MSSSKLLILAALVFALAPQAAFAGAPLKGVECKLGKNKGSCAAARTSSGKPAPHSGDDARVKSKSNISNN